MIYPDPHEPLVHWRRPLRSGGVEFFFRAGRSRFSGSVTPAANVDGLQALCEKAWGVKLPEPEWRAMRGGRR